MGGACSTYGGVLRCIQSLVGNPEGKSYFEDPGIDGKIILRWIFSKWEVRAWTGAIWIRIGTGDGHL